MSCNSPKNQWADVNVMCCNDLGSVTSDNPLLPFSNLPSVLLMNEYSLFSNFSYTGASVNVGDLKFS